MFNSSADLDLKDTNYILWGRDVSPPSLTLYNSGDIFMQKEHADLTEVLDASQISLICSISHHLFSLYPALKYLPLNQNMHFTYKPLVLSSLLFTAGFLNTLLQLAEFAFKFHRFVQSVWLGKPLWAIRQAVGTLWLCSHVSARWQHRLQSAKPEQLCSLSPTCRLAAMSPSSRAVLVSPVLLSGL